MIIRGAQNIAPRLVEEAVGKHPAVSEVAVVGVPDAVYGERVCAAVALRGGAALDLPSLVTFLRTTSLPTFALPERLEVFPALPKNAAGKIGTAAVRELVLARSVTT